MALPSSGTIKMSQVDTELGLSSTATLNLGNSIVRTLFGVSSGAISLSQGHGKSACTASGTYLGSFCSGTTVYYSYANGSCGTYNVSQGQQNGNCGYCDPAWTDYGGYCDGNDYIHTYADGNCGSFQQTESNSTNCGCSGAGYGQELYNYCSGGDFISVQSDGSCNGVMYINEGSQCGQCGNHPCCPDAGSFAYTICNGLGALYYIYWSGQSWCCNYDWGSADQCCCRYIDHIDYGAC